MRLLALNYFFFTAFIAFNAKNLNSYIFSLHWPQFLPFVANFSVDTSTRVHGLDPEPIWWIILRLKARARLKGRLVIFRRFNTTIAIQFNSFSLFSFGCHLLTAYDFLSRRCHYFTKLFQKKLNSIFPRWWAQTTRHFHLLRFSIHILNFVILAMCRSRWSARLRGREGGCLRPILQFSKMFQFSSCSAVLLRSIHWILISGQKNFHHCMFLPCYLF